MNPELARSILLDHSRSKKNGQLPSPMTHQAKVINPACGDQVEIGLHISGHEILAAGFSARACAICTASSSLLSERLKGSSIVDALHTAKEFEAAIVASASSEWPASLIPLRSFEHLRVNPMRRTCALLPWTALKKALST